MQGHSLPRCSDSDEYAVEEFTFTQTVCGEKNDKSVPFGKLPDKVLSWPIMRIEQITFSATSFEGMTSGCVQEVF